MNGAGTRALVRVARRNIGRSRWRSLLVVVLILLPVAAMVAGTAIMVAVTPTAEQTATHEMGQADAIVYPSSEGATEPKLREVLPGGSRIEPFLYTEDQLVLTGMQASVTVRSMQVDGLARGMVTLKAGRPPANPEEVAISPSVAQLTGAEIGDQVDLRGLGALTVVGIGEDPFSLSSRFLLADPAIAQDAPDGQATWLVDVPGDLDVYAVFVASVDGRLFSVRPRGGPSSSADQASPAIVVLGGLAMVEVALVAAAAFAVGVQRRQRELGLLAASGAAPRHLAGTVLAEGLLLGVVGSLGAIAVGMVGALAVSPWLDQLTDRRTAPIALSMSWTLLAVSIGIGASLLAALFPSWTASRVSVMTALSGRRPPSAPAHRSLALGVALVALAFGLTLGGAALRLQDGDSPLSIPMLLLGAVLGTLGFGACSPWLVERLERPARHLPLASRIALRDTARARSRSGPIITAILASFAATVSVAAFSASSQAAALAQFQPYMQPDQIYLQGNVDEAGPEIARQLGAIAAAPVPGIAGKDAEYPVLSTGSGASRREYLNISIGDAELLKVLHAEDAVAELQAGSVVLITQDRVDTPTATLAVTDAQGTATNSMTLPVANVTGGLAPGMGNVPEAVVSAETARRLDLQSPPNHRYLIRLGRDATDADLIAAADIAGAYPDTFADAALPPRLPDEGYRLAMIAASLVLALSVTGIAVALGEAESRPEQRTLLALGAHPQLRRRIAAARAGAIALFAGLLAVPAGLLPVWGLLASRDVPLVVPVPEVLAAVVALPVLAMLGALILSRPIPSWSAFRDLAR
jgi:putative ABC transport system permease protein